MRTYDMRAGEAGEVEHRQPESRMLRPRWVLLFAPIICAMLVSRVRVLMSVVHANKLQFYESCCFLACAVLSSSDNVDDVSGTMLKAAPGNYQGRQSR